MNLSDIIKSILEKTAWRMDPPELFGRFHILALCVTMISAVLLAALITAPFRQTSPAGRHFSEAGDTDQMDRRQSRMIRLLTVCGWILVIMEVFKQLFLYYIVNGGAYDWWFFPFQLCSVPMYLCILLPSVRGRIRDAFLTFMAGYTFVSAVAALVYPQDLLRPYVALTAHGFIWHGILLFISMIIVMSGIGDLSWRGFARGTMLFLILCAAAIGINAAIESFITGSYTYTYPAMFYLNPLRISPQPLVGTVQQMIGPPAGIAVGLALYICVIIAVSALCTRIFYRRLGSR